MAVLDIVRNYNNGEALLAADLDVINNSVESLVNTTKISGDNIQANSIDASLKVIDASINTAKIAGEAVTTAKLADGAITTAKIAAGAITSAKLADGAITSAKLAANSITTAKISDGSIDRSLQASLGEQLSAQANKDATTTSEVDVTNASITITTTGKPVQLNVQSTAAGDLSLQGVAYPGNLGFDGSNNIIGGAASQDSGTYFRWYRGATLIATYEYRITHNIFDRTSPISLPVGSLQYIDEPVAGTYTYKLTIQGAYASPNQSKIGYCKVVAFELT
jgi:hypothetical protein